jgi:hypothetical protein
VYKRQPDDWFGPVPEPPQPAAAGAGAADGGGAVAGPGAAGRRRRTPVYLRIGHFIAATATQHLRQAAHKGAIHNDLSPRRGGKEGAALAAASWHAGNAEAALAPGANIIACALRDREVEWRAEQEESTGPAASDDDDDDDGEYLELQGDIERALAGSGSDSDDA